MKLERLEVGRLRGGSAGFKLEGVSSGLNLLLGPNGSGKSSLCAALSTMLWPESGVVPEAEMVAWWSDDAGAAQTGGELRGELRAPGRSPVALVEWQRAGAATGRPDLPPAQVAPVYTLGLRDLLEEDRDSDRGLAARIRIEMSGGFDIDEVRSRLGRRFGRAQVAAWRETTAARDRLLADRRRLAEEDDRLIDLRAVREQAETAQRSLEGLGQAVEAAGLRARLAELDAGLAELVTPVDVLAMLRGDELERLEVLSAEWGDARQECEEAAAVVAELEQERVALCLSEPRPNADGLSQLGELSAELREAQIDRQNKETRFANARHESDAVAESLAGEVDAPKLAHVDFAAIETAAGWVGRALRHATRHAQLQGAIEAAGGGRTDIRAIAAEADAVRRQSDVLREWLASPVAEPPRSRAGDILLLVCGLALSALTPWTTPWLLLPAGVMVGAAVARLLVPQDERAGIRAAVEARCSELSASGDAEADRIVSAVRFESRAVREAVGRLDARLAHLARCHEDAIALSERRREVARLDEEAASLAADRAALAKRIGIDPGQGDVAFAELLDRVGRYREAESARARAESEYGEANSRIEQLTERMFRALPGGSVTRDRSVATLIRAAEDLKQRCDRDEGLVRELDQARARLARSTELADRACARRAALLERAQIPDTESEEQVSVRLASLLEVHATHRGLMEERRAAERQLRVLERALAEQPALARLDRESAAVRLDEARTRAEQVGDLADEIARIEERVQAAAASGELEAREDDVARSEAALVEARDALVLAIAGDFLLDEVESEYERHTQPALLRVASELFARFTHHRYRLDVARDESGGSFRARDTESGKGLALGELSDGTRMQLLLAARLAFAVHAEGAERPPLFLDEALTASDPGRFRAVAGALLELAANGRQIFYLTCNPADVALFGQVCAEHAAPAPPVFDLGGLRELGAGFDDASALTLRPPATIPAPGDDSPERYALRLDVPRPMPDDSVDRLHLFHLLREDLPTLYRLLSEGRIERVGHWRSLQRSAAIRSLLGPEQCAHVNALVGIAEHYLEAYAIGRGRPVDRAVLEETGAVSKRFIDQMTALAHELDGDARALVGAIESRRVARFHADKLDALREALEGSGHLDPATPLDADALRTRALAGLSPDAGEGAEGFDIAAAQRLIDWLETLYRPGQARRGAP